MLIAGMGNVLCADDGFGVAVANELLRRSLPPHVKVIEVGIGGMHLVQALMDGYEALVIVDAVERGAPPGTLFVLEPDVPELESLPPGEAHGIVAATHHTVPARVLLLARALGVLPAQVTIVGCQPGPIEGLAMGLSSAVRKAVTRAVAQVERMVGDARVA
jgi:hydrogenase maturation protease